jgi:hypothetical protein
MKSKRCSPFLEFTAVVVQFQAAYLQYMYIDDVLYYSHEKVGYDGHLVLDYGRVQLSFISQSIRADHLKSNDRHFT